MLGLGCRLQTDRGLLSERNENAASVESDAGVSCWRSAGHGDRFHKHLSSNSFTFESDAEINVSAICRSRHSWPTLSHKYKELTSSAYT